ncbi:MAG: hypothetical protein K2M47_00420, partial [Clostridiales bacterium]|nr:hypothetical protein [Clostridiales bacterium]
MDLRGLDTSELANIASMFSGCNNLLSVNLSGLNFSSVMTANAVFECNSLRTIKTPAQVGSVELPLPCKFWDGTKDITSITNADVNKTIYRHQNHTYNENGICTVCGNANRFAVIKGNNTQYYNFIRQAFDEANAVGTATVKMYADAEIDFTLDVEKNKNITLDLNSHTLQMTGIGSVIHVQGEFTLEDNTINDGLITGGNAELGGGVLVDAYLASFTMKGGTISGNTATVNGGGVYGYASYVTIESGNICGNTALQRGGGVYVVGCDLAMTGGTVTGNTAVEGGGVYATYESGFEFNGGTVTGNTAELGGGVHINNGTFNMTAGEISGNSAAYGSGVWLGGNSSVSSATFTMSSGVIDNNTGLEDQLTDVGGGVCVVLGGTFTMSGGIISNHAATYGGGVCAVGGTFTMTTGEISGNDAVYGGGVWVGDKLDGTNNLIGGKFTISGGTIIRNTVSDSGGGVHVYGGVFEISGSPHIIANIKDGDANNVYLENGKKITVTAAITVGVQIGVYNNGEVATGFTQGGAPKNYFISDRTEYDCVYLSNSASGVVTVGTHTGGTATCTAKAVCSNCGNEYGEFNHDWNMTTWENDADTHWHVCNNCDERKDETTHSGGAATCTALAECAICSEEYGDFGEHTLNGVAQVDKTCTTDGVLAHDHCSVCNKDFIDGVEKSAAELKIPASHNLTFVDIQNKTCTTDGVLAHDHCSVCNKDFIDGAEKTADELKITASHNLTFVDIQDKTCTTDGVLAHDHCSVCNKDFIDGVEKTAAE